jgi:catechol 2,3-dioxygenase-like lactoylglutathione lyase family enzyme
MSSNNPEPKISIRYLFNHTADLEATRAFYTEMIGLKETAFEAEWGFLCYQCEGFELMFFRAENGRPAEPGGWASQPGYQGGSIEAISWAIGVPEELFRDVVNRLKAAEQKAFAPDPEWRQNSYWGYTVMDPNGITVEVFSAPAKPPASTEWK